MLKHRAAEQAGEIFARGNRMFPRSTRMLLGRTVAGHSRGSFETAANSIFAAADLDPASLDPSVPETHYRLALAWRRAGETELAKRELDLYQRSSRQSGEAEERERSATIRLRTKVSRPG